MAIFSCTLLQDATLLYCYLTISLTILFRGLLTLLINSSKQNCTKKKPEQMLGKFNTDVFTFIDYISIKNIYLVLFAFVVFQARVSLCSPGCPGTSSCRSGWPWTQRSSCLCLQSAGIKGVCHHCLFIAAIPACFKFSLLRFICKFCTSLLF